MSYSSLLLCLTLFYCCRINFIRSSNTSNKAVLLWSKSSKRKSLYLGNITLLPNVSYDVKDLD